VTQVRAVRSKKFVYRFGGPRAEGAAAMRDLLGGKGANVAEMANLGVPVPPGFTITTEACAHFMAHAGNYPEGLLDEVAEHLRGLETETGK